MSSALPLITADLTGLAWFLLGLGVSGISWAWRTFREVSGSDEEQRVQAEIASVAALRSEAAGGITVPAPAHPTGPGATPGPASPVSPQESHVPLELRVLARQEEQRASAAPSLGHPMRLEHVYCPACGTAVAGAATSGFRLYAQCPSCHRRLAIRIEYRRAGVEVDEVLE